MDFQDKIESQRFAIGRLDYYIESVQTKCNLYIALNTVIIGGIIAMLFNSTDNLTGLQVIFLFITSVLSVICIILTLLVINPFLKKSASTSNYFFKSISGKKLDLHISEIKELKVENDLVDLITQKHLISKGLNRKYGLLQCISILMIVEFILLLIWVFTYLLK